MASTVEQARILLNDLASRGHRVSAKGETVKVRTGGTKLTDEDRMNISRLRVELWGIVLFEGLRRLMQTIDMAGLRAYDLPMGVQEDFGKAWCEASELVGSVWPLDEEEITIP